MSNSDVIEQLDALTGEARLLRNDLDRSDDMPPLATATALVKLVKLNADFAKTAKAAKKALAPLFGKDAGDADADQGGGKKPKK